MKPAWDQLGDEYASSSSVVIGDADCTASGKSLCDANDVRGYPTIKYYNAEFPDGETYNGGRDFESLKKFTDESLSAMRWAPPSRARTTRPAPAAPAGSCGMYSTI